MTTTVESTPADSRISRSSWAIAIGVAAPILAALVSLVQIHPDGQVLSWTTLFVVLALLFASAVGYQRGFSLRGMGKLASVGAAVLATAAESIIVVALAFGLPAIL